MTTYHSRILLSLAAKYAVASEICRHGTYAQLNLESKTRTDFLVFSEDDKIGRIAKEFMDPMY